MFKSLSLKVILFGFIFTFFSSFGQSFFLGLFNQSIREALSITHGQFGSIYASATLLSSIVLVWIGKKIDDVNILKFASYVIIFLSISCFIFSKISSVIFLFIGIFLMRLSGQGLSSHTATTTISRFFEKNRGRALSTGWLGLSLAEFILPVLICDKSRSVVRTTVQHAGPNSFPSARQSRVPCPVSCEGALFCKQIEQTSPGEMGDARTQRDSAHPAPLAGRAAHSNTRHIYAVRLLVTPLPRP